MESVKQLHASGELNVETSTIECPVHIPGSHPEKFKVNMSPAGAILTVGLSVRARRKVVPVLACTSKSFHVRKWRAPFR